MRRDAGESTDAGDENARAESIATLATHGVPPALADAELLAAAPGTEDDSSQSLEASDESRTGRSRRRRGRRGGAQRAGAGAAEGSADEAADTTGDDERENGDDKATTDVETAAIEATAAEAQSAGSTANTVSDAPSTPRPARRTEAPRSSDSGDEDARVIPESLRKPPLGSSDAEDEAVNVAPPAPAPVEPASARVAAPEAPAERVAPKEAAEPITPAPLPKDRLESIVESAGLQWVETTHHAAPPQPETVPPPRKPRVRKPRSAASAEPLEQVETDRPK